MKRSTEKPGPDTPLGRGIHDILTERIGEGADPAAAAFDDLYAGLAADTERGAELAAAEYTARLEDENADLRCRVHELERELSEVRAAAGTEDERVERAVLQERRRHVAGRSLTSIIWAGAA